MKNRTSSMPRNRAGKYWHQGRWGQSVVELAFMIPVMIALLLVVSDYARVFYAYLEVSDAARAGAQYGMQNRATAADLSRMQTTAVSAAPDLTAMTATASSFCTCSDGGATVSCSSSGCPTTLQLFVQVTTNYTFKTIFAFPGIPGSVALQGISVLRVS
jgi:Flp pilus assembly protein TadG